MLSKTSYPLRTLISFSFGLVKNIAFVTASEASNKLSDHSLETVINIYGLVGFYLCNNCGQVKRLTNRNFACLDF